MKIEIHLLQNFAPSCLNRDDTNTPKSCEFGGVPRARVSSQSYKRAVREFFRAENSVPVGKRTKQLHSELMKRLGDDFDAAKVTKFLEECYSKMDGKIKEGKINTAVLVFVSPDEVEAAEACLRENLSAKDALVRLGAARQSADLALFGRMLAEKPDRNVDAACQVAHCLSTHAVNLETDFYTAVDDLTQDRDEIGAGMLGTQGFNSACFYRYALLDTDQLTKNLNGDTKQVAQVIEAFLQAFTLAIPSAKQNSHAAQNLPSFGLLVARDKGVPVSLANAFARPIRSDDIIGASIHALTSYQARLQSIYGLYDGATVAVFHDRTGNKELGGLAGSDKNSFKNAVATVMERVSQ